MQVCSYFLQGERVWDLLHRFDSLLAILAPYKPIALFASTLNYIRYGQFEKALEIIENFAAATGKLMANQIVPMTIFSHCAIAPIILWTEWKDAEEGRLEVCFKQLLEPVKRIWLKVAVPARFGCELLEAASLLAAGMQRKAVQFLKEKMSQHNRRSQSLGIFPAFHAAVIARFSEVAKERQ
ncbi:hypothetical protein HDU67_006013, partial [Dinochytrium kinnereticum]